MSGQWLTDSKRCEAEVRVSRSARDWVLPAKLAPRTSDLRCVAVIRMPVSYVEVLCATTPWLDCRYRPEADVHRTGATPTPTSQCEPNRRVLRKQALRHL
jgi:hypothetical protein